MRVVGHSDPRIAMDYQHPELGQIRHGLKAGNRSAEARVQQEIYGTFCGGMAKKQLNETR
jgi:hypothetical protein